MMKKIKIRLLTAIMCISLLFGVAIEGRTVCAETSQAGSLDASGADVPAQLQNLYAQSAVLMDADSGRVLFEKNGYDQKAMASTTKIMTCILALENGKPDDIVTVSSLAAGQPKVHLGMVSGEQFYLKDLLYSLMLESHNDSAYAIAEHIGGSVEGFAEMMNAKAKELGCERTYFITPNGLDAVNENGVHSTTAADLALIMRYCIRESPQKQEFLEITQKPNYGFSNVECTRSFQCNNHNAFLQMMEGALSGKTGFTGDAGYCYVGALEKDGKTFIVALLACGWPNNKGYKWSDTKQLMTYGLEHYTYRDVWENITLNQVPVTDGIPDGEILGGKASVSLRIKNQNPTISMLLKEDETVEVSCEVPDVLAAPVKADAVVGKVTYTLANNIIRQYDIVTEKAIGKLTFQWCFEKISEMFCV